LRAVQLLWENIRQHHLTLGGGPWGGVGHRSREVFNPSHVFSPYGYVETCSTFAWIQLNRELLALTGDAKYAGEIEKSAYNDLLGAQAPSGDNWCYYSYPNGKRVFTTYWRCCKSSGPLALEELPSLAYAMTADGDVAVNLYGDSRATLQVRTAGTVQLEQATRYPFDGAVRITVRMERAATFAIRLRIPSWAEQPSIAVNDDVVGGTSAKADTYFELRREWADGDVIALQFAMPPLLHFRTNRSVQESRAPDGSPVAQEVMRYDYVAITRGPLVYATGLIDEFKIEETIRLPDDRRSLLEVVDATAEHRHPQIRLHLGYREPLTFVPYFEAGGRTDGVWRLTWLQLAPS
jgi:hypothetical protein